MTTVWRLLQTFGLVLGLFAVAACDDDDGGGGGDGDGDGGGDRSCTVLCEEAQAGACTNITGDCAAFCGAIDSSKDAASCSQEVSDYLECQNGSKNVCDPPGCGASENAVIDCYTPYCAANLDDPDCMTLIDSF